MSEWQFSEADVASLARKLYGEPNRRLSTQRELRFGRRGSLAVIPARGVFQDHEAGTAGGVLDMIMHSGQARTRADAVRLLKSDGIVVAPEHPAERSGREMREEAEAKRKLACAAGYVASARPLRGTLAETYLRTARAIGAPLGMAHLGFLAEAPVYPYSADCRDRRPAMIARISDPVGRTIGAHLTFLRPDGLGKASLPVARKVVGKSGGGFVRLAPGARLVVAEGIESALSAWGALGPAPDLGCIAGISAEGLARLTWPAEIAALIIAPDQDASGVGEAAAERLAIRADAEGLNVSLLRPPAGFADWNAWAMSADNTAWKQRGDE